MGSRADVLGSWTWSLSTPCPKPAAGHLAETAASAGGAGKDWACSRGWHWREAGPHGQALLRQPCPDEAGVMG